MGVTTISEIGEIQDIVEKLKKRYCNNAVALVCSRPMLFVETGIDHFQFDYYYELLY